MKYIRPSYYQEFECIADRCPDTCCSGWKIAIDDKTLQRYQAYTGGLRNRLHNTIDWNTNSFSQYNRKCGFLNEDNLCDLYQEAGPDALCHTCKTYPRHVEEFKGVKEYSLMLSCPEAARLILTNKTPFTMLNSEKTVALSPKEKRLTKDFDTKAYDFLVEAREVLFGLINTTTYPVRIRMGLVLGLSHDLQKRVQAQNYEEARKLLAHYQQEEIQAKLAKKLLKRKQLSDNTMAVRSTFMKSCSKLTVIHPEWEERTMLTRFLLYQDGGKEYKALSSQILTEITAMENGEFYENLKRNLMNYFVYSYYCGAVYDGDQYSKIKLAVFSVLALEEYIKAERVDRGKPLTVEQILRLCHQYSREVEHIDENIDHLERLFQTKKEFSLQSFLIALE